MRLSLVIRLRKSLAVNIAPSAGDSREKYDASSSQYATGLLRRSSGKVLLDGQSENRWTHCAGEARKMDGRNGCVSDIDHSVCVFCAWRPLSFSLPSSSNRVSCAAKIKLAKLFAQPRKGY